MEAPPKPNGVNGVTSSSHGQPDGNTVTGPDPGPDQYREGYRQLLAPVPSGTRHV
jgi:hypothetical protein